MKTIIISIVVGALLLLSYFAFSIIGGGNSVEAMGYLVFFLIFFIVIVGGFLLPLIVLWLLRNKSNIILTVIDVLFSGTLFGIVLSYIPDYDIVEMTGYLFWGLFIFAVYILIIWKITIRKVVDFSPIKKILIHALVIAILTTILISGYGAIAQLDLL